MKKLTITLSVLAFAILFGPGLQAQKNPASDKSSTDKGVAPVGATLAVAQPGTTRAVVVGISDYQDPAIPDLRFADRDAEAFANWLHASAGGNATIDNIRLLLNDQATNGQFGAAVGWLIEQTREGDRAVIYFSGHGDMEARILNQLGFLLLWDSPAQAYISGALSVDMLKQVVTTLSVEKKAKVLVVADACRAGKLAGNNIIGTQLTNANLAKQFANEQKILSCQADEYSVEGEQWGGGRGAFSWHLVNGLYGLADHNGDRDITLLEIERFIQDRVTSEVKPLSQIPLAIGDKTALVGQVDEATSEGRETGKELPLVNFSGVEQRGLVQEVLAKADTGIVQLYQAFLLALKEKRFWEPADDCADVYYERLMVEPKLAPLHNFTRRNYAAALQDDAQQFMASMLKSTTTEWDSPNLRLYPRQLERAAALLGEKHYLYKTLKARQYMYEGMAAHFTPTWKDVNQKSLALYRKSLEYEPNSPHPFLFMIIAYKNSGQSDSAYWCMQEASRLAPSWILPYTVYASVDRDFERSEAAMGKATEIDPTNPTLWRYWSNWYFELGKYEEALDCLKRSAELLGDTVDYTWMGQLLEFEGRVTEAEAAYRRAIALDSSDIFAWFPLGSLYAKNRRYEEAEQVLKKVKALDPIDSLWWFFKNLYMDMGRYEDAILLCKNLIALDSMDIVAWNNLGDIYYRSTQYAETKLAWKKVVALDSTQAIGWSNLGFAYLKTSQYAEAEQAFRQCLALDTTMIGAWNGLGQLCLNQNRYAESEPAYRKLIELDSANAVGWNGLGLTLLLTHRYAEAESVLQKSISLDPEYAYPQKHLATLHFRTGRREEARQGFEKVLEMNPDYRGGYLGMAYLHAAEDKTAKALEFVEQAIGKNATLEQLESDEDLAPLRSRGLGTEWKALMKKHFPDQVKD